jgi:hypothetical protein
LRGEREKTMKYEIVTENGIDEMKMLNVDDCIVWGMNG